MSEHIPNNSLSEETSRQIRNNAPDMFDDITITLDTMCFIEKEKDEDISKLFQLNRNGYLTIFKTDVADTEMSESSKEKSKDIPEDMGVGRVCHSRIGHAITGGEDDSLYKNIMNVVFPETKGEPPKRNKIRDVMALTVHTEKKRTVFVTKDGAICRAKESLKNQFGITVMSPPECVEYILQKFT